MIEKKYYAPNAITAANMLLGYLSILSSIKGNFTYSVGFIILAMICDTLDGKTARKLDAFSEFGKEFDSFSDAISFGLAPGIFIYSLLSMSNSPLAGFATPISFIYSLCGVMRLVKFNVMTVASSEKADFSGMPIPSGASLVVSFYMFYVAVFGGDLTNFPFQIFGIVSVLAAVLMVSTIPFKTLDRGFAFVPKKIFPFFFIFVLVTMTYSLFLATAFYVISNLTTFFTKRMHQEESEENKPHEI